MIQQISRALVIGAGNMGAGIAAQLANAGVQTVLLDRVLSGESSRNCLAERAIERQMGGGGFMHPDRTRLVQPGNMEDDLEQLALADWIIEAVYEDLDVKRSLYAEIEKRRRPGSIVSSNTSTIPLAHLVEGLGESFARDFVITHFFNPPRVMKLVELVSGPATAKETVDRADAWCAKVMGKTVVRCRDTPGFIANRVGNYWMSVAVLEAKRLGLTVEQADAVMSAPFGIPRTGIFGLFDYVGINLVPLVWGSFMKSLAASDPHRRHDITRDKLILGMLAQGLTGRNAGSGFYRTRQEGANKMREAMDLGTGAYRPLEPARLTSLDVAGRDLRKLCEQGDAAGRYAWSVLSHTVSYAAEVGPEIADDVESIDVAMRLGYNWAAGPFELADRVGCEWIRDRLLQEGRAVPALLGQAAAAGGFYQEGRPLDGAGQRAAANAGRGGFSIGCAKRSSGKVAGNGSASLWGVGEGILALEVHTKMNACNEQVVDLLEAAPRHVQAGFRALILANDHARAFSVGADLGHFVAYAKAADWPGMIRFVTRGQAALLALRRAAFPVVGAPFGLALGGGCELQLSCHASVAHAELNAGLPEVKVGILPGWGGCTRLLERWTERCGGDAFLGAKNALEVLVDGKVTSSALQAVDRALLRPSDRIVMNRDFVITEARSLAVAMCEAPRPTKAAVEFKVKGTAGADALIAHLQEMRADLDLNEHDLTIARAMAEVLTGGAVPPGTVVGEEHILALEVERMVALSRMPQSLARMEHMLTTGRPLRN